MESRVAERRMTDASAHSTKKVDSPAWIRSPAPPNRANTASAGLNTQLCAGTGAPICARTTATHVARSSVDLPPMFGPVKSIAGGSLRSFPAFPSATSFGTTASPTPSLDDAVTAHGCQRSFASNVASSPSARVTNEGRHIGLLIPPSRAKLANALTASSVAHAAAAAVHVPE